MRSLRSLHNDEAGKVFIHKFYVKMALRPSTLLMALGSPLLQMDPWSSSLRYFQYDSYKTIFEIGAEAFIKIEDKSFPFYPIHHLVLANSTTSHYYCPLFVAHARSLGALAKKVARLGFIIVKSETLKCLGFFPKIKKDILAQDDDSAHSWTIFLAILFMIYTAIFLSQSQYIIRQINMSFSHALFVLYPTKIQFHTLPPNTRSKTIRSVSDAVP